jgi:hypothetical protein
MGIIVLTRLFSPNWVYQTAGLIERLRRQRQEQVATRAPDQSALPAR